MFFLLVLTPLHIVLALFALGTLLLSVMMTVSALVALVVAVSAVVATVAIVLKVNVLVIRAVAVELTFIAFLRLNDLLGTAEKGTDGNGLGEFVENCIGIRGAHHS
jgi:hypothetical protein